MEDGPAQVGRWVLACPLPLPGDAFAFAWYLIAAAGRKVAPGNEGGDVVEARRRLQCVNRVAFRRYLAGVGRE